MSGVALLAPPPLGSWADHATCRYADPEVFYPPKGDPASEARRVCGNCPVIEACLDYALTYRIADGVWGGMTPNQRRLLPRPRQDRGRDVQPCGTPAAYRRHRRSGEPACEACTAAHASYYRERAS